PGRIAKGRMRRDVLDALAVDPDLAAVTEAFQELLAGQRPRDTTAHTTSSGGSYRALGGDGRLSGGHRRAHLGGHQVEQLQHAPGSMTRPTAPALSPPTRIGGCGFCTGFGARPMSSKR